jgi:hypothetical protein
MRRLTLIVSVLVLLAAVIPAAAGGAVWEFEGYHEPGDVVESSTAVAWGHNADLGRPEDGPYLVYLAPADGVTVEWPDTPEDGLLVGIVEVHEGLYTRPNGESYGPHHAIARFEIPDVSPGVYQIFHCNDPCTTTLGDVVGGWDLRIAGGENGRPADVIASEVMERVADVPLIYPASAPEDAVEAPASFPVDRLWFWVVGAVCLLLTVRLVWSDPNRSVRAAAREPDDQTEVLR